MRNGDTYPRNTALAILLAGEPGAGKTCTTMALLDRPYILDTDHNLRNAIERHTKPFSYDDPEVDEQGKPLDLDRCWQRMEQLIKENAPKPEVGAIVVDGVGRVTDYLKAYLCREGSQMEKGIKVGGLPQMTQTLWMPYADLLKRLVFLCRAYGKPFVMTTHLSVDENELTTIKEQRPLIQGSLKADFAKLFTDYWMCDATPNSDPKYKASGGVRYYVRTQPTVRVKLKQSCGLPPEFEVGDENFQKLVARLAPVPVAQSAEPIK